VSQLQLTIILSLACYRVTRFIVEDTLIAGFRIWLHTVILGRKPRLWREKLQELISCQFCISVWIAGALVSIADYFGPVALPGIQWAAVAAGSIIIWQVVEE